MRTCRWTGLVVFVAGVLFSSSTFASGFVAPEGTIWMKVDYSRWTADSKFAGLFDRDLRNGVDLGDRIPFDSSTGGEFESDSIALSFNVVPLARWEIGGYIPFWQRSKFSDLAFSTVTTGTGDFRFYTGYQIANLENVATTVRAHVKIPTTTLPTEFDSVPLSEGQYDVAIEQTTTWAPASALHLTLGTLIRKRFAFTDENRELKPGDEAELTFEVGGSPLISNLWIKAGYRGLWSTGNEDRSSQGAVTLSERRIVHELNVGAYVEWGSWIGESLRGLAVDGGFVHAFDGTDFPAGPSWSVGLAYSNQFW